MQVEWQNWMDGSGIGAVEVLQLKQSETRPVVKVSLHGEYLCDGQNESARVLRMAMAAALAWEHRLPVGVVLDLTDLNYFGGDTLVAWDGLLAAEPFGSRVAFLCNDSNWWHVQSLLDEVGDATSMRAFRTEQDALLFVLDV